MFLDKMGEYQNFPSRKYWPIVPKKVGGEPFCAVLQNLPVAKIYG